MKEERRKSIRFPARDDVIGVLRNGFTEVGKVKDLSMAGLSLEHIYDHDKDPKGSETKREIVLLVNGFSLSKIFGRVIYEIPVCMPEDFDPFPIHFKTKRCGVQFEPLSAEQAFQLDFFLETYARGGHPSIP